jgi:hypothetical protein
VSTIDPGTQAADVGWFVVHATAPGGPVTIATRLVGDRGTAEQTAAAMQANSDGIGHYLAVHAIAETDLRDCPDYYGAVAALRGTRPPSLHPGADDTQTFDRAALDAFIGKYRLPDAPAQPHYTAHDIEQFRSFLAGVPESAIGGTVHTGPYGGEAA